MSVYQEAQNLILSLPEKNVKWIIDLIHMMTPSDSRSNGKPIKLGVAKGKFRLDDERFDAMDGEVSAMFEGDKCNIWLILTSFFGLWPGVISSPLPQLTL